MSKTIEIDRQKFEKWHNEFYGPQDEFNPIRSLDFDSRNVGLGYDDPTVQAQFCAFQGALAAPAVERQEPVGFRYRANGDWELMEESPFADGRISHKEGGEELQPLYTSPTAPVAVVVDETQAFANWMHEVVAIERHNNYVAKIQRKDRMSRPEEKSAYDAWNARACLDKVKEMNQ